MRLAFAPLAALPLASLCLGGAASAQALDRYGGGGPMPTPAYAPQPAQAAPAGYASPPGYAPAPYAAAPAGYGAPVYPSMAAYGPAPAAPRQGPPRQGAPRPTMTPGMASAGLRTLSWPGKDPVQPQTAVLQSPQAMSGYRPLPQTYGMAPPHYAPSGMTQPTPYVPAPTAQATPAPRYGFATPPTTPRPAPTSIYSDAPAPGPQAYAAQPASPQRYAPAPTAPQPYAQTFAAPQAYTPQAYAYAPAAAAAPQLSSAPASAAVSGGSRQYSVHREYGLTPDAAPIPPQFFANTADLSAPETPDVPTPRVTGNATTAKATENAARLAASATP